MREGDNDRASWPRARTTSRMRLRAFAACRTRRSVEPLHMKPRVSLSIVDKLHSTIDSATRLHRLGLLLFVLACVCVSLPQAGMPRWMQLAGLLATGLAFVIKAAGTLREIRLAKVLRQVMGMPEHFGQPDFAQCAGGL